MRKKILQFIRKHRGAAPLRLIAAGCERYLRAWHNEGFYEFSKNGEDFVLKTFLAWKGSQPYVVWDVGANHGQWAVEARGILGNVTVVSFELIEPIAEALERTVDPTWHRVIRSGLSDAEGELEVLWNQTHDTTTSLAPRLESRWFQGAELVALKCRLSTVDSFIAGGEPPPTLLKIDVEGADAAVLRGARGLLTSPAAPDMIQFEYGTTWISFGELLRPTAKLLADAGYRIGRVYPDHVEFRAYSLADEHFRMGNYIAAKDVGLIERLAANRKAA